MTNEAQPYSAPLFDIRAEQHLLGSVLKCPEEFQIVVAIIGEDPQVFFFHAHQLIYSGMLALKRAGKPLNELSLVEQLKADGTLGEVSRCVCLGKLSGAVPTSGLMKFYQASAGEALQ